MTRTIQKIPSTTKFQHMLWLVLNEQTVTKWTNIVQKKKE